MPIKLQNLNDVLEEKLAPFNKIIFFCEQIATTRFVMGLAILLCLWFAGNLYLDHVSHTALTPATFMVVTSVINCAYTIASVMKERARNKRDEVTADHSYEVNSQVVDLLTQILKEQRYHHRDLRMTVIQSAPDLKEKASPSE